MPAARCNYIVVYDNSPQVFSSSTLETILKGDPPKNCTIDQRSILFLSYFPDEKELKVFEVTPEEVALEEKRLEDKQNARAAKLAEETSQTSHIST